MNHTEDNKGLHICALYIMWIFSIEHKNDASASIFLFQGLPPEPKKTEPGKPDLSSLNSWITRQHNALAYIELIDVKSDN